MAASADCSTPRRHPEAATLVVSYPVAADAVIYKGALVALTAGYAGAAAAASGVIVVGIAEESVDNTGGDDGDLDVLVASGNAFRLVGSSIVAADVGKVAYLSDDITVADAPGTYGIVVGTIEELETTDVVWVYIPPTNALARTGIQALQATPTACLQSAVTAGEITALIKTFTFPFTVAHFSVTYRSALGLQLAATNLATSTGATVNVVLDAAGAPKLIATDIVAVVASA
jgi:hypothetical protein